MNRASTGTAASLLACVLAACGGGGDEGGCRNLDPGRDASLPGCIATAAPGAPTALAPLAVTLSDANGAPVTTVSSSAPGVAKAVVKDGSGRPVAGVAVQFTSTDKTAVLVPASGSALTDSSGVASIGVAPGTTAGAFTLAASAASGGATATGSTSYAVAFPVLTMSALAIGPSPLPAGGTASLSVTLLDGTRPFTPAQQVVFTSPCATAGKATISSPVTTINGVATTSYIDKGCGAPDVVTASTTLAGATTTQSGTVNVERALPGQLAFVSALPQNISLKGTGGAGRQESSTVVFKLRDPNGNPVSGQRVDFALSTTVGDLRLSQASATTGADGTASTIVFGGTVNTPVRVIASIPGSRDSAGQVITTVSDQLVVSTGVPDQDSFSLSTEIYNVEGMAFDGCPAPNGSNVTVRLADHFNNPAPDGTAVSFTAEGGSIDGSCLTGLVNTTLTDGTVIQQKGIPGACTVRFCAANPRPADGRVTVLAYALGEESFFDTNGTNLYYQSPDDPFQDLGEPFRNDRAITNRHAQANWGVAPTQQAPFNPLSPDDRWYTNNGQRVSGETFIDSNANRSWDRTGDNEYNGVLRLGAASTRPVTHVRGALVQVLSTSTSAVTSLDAQEFALSRCVSGTPFVNTPVTLRLAIRDTNPTVFGMNRAGAAGSLDLPFDLPGNILPAGTKIEFIATNGTLLSPNSIIVPNTNEPSAAGWIYPVQMQSDATQNLALNCFNTVSSASLTVKVTTPSGIISMRSYPVND
ncbi:hypothetical protein [Massilia sp. SYSU DXS3249]